MSSSDEDDKKAAGIDRTRALDDFMEDHESRKGSRVIGNKLRSIHPLGMRVVVQIRREADMTETGLYLPEGAREARQVSWLGEVLEVASAIDRDTQEEANISGIPEGALVLIRKDAGVAVPWDDDLRVVETKEILAIVEETDII